MNKRLIALVIIVGVVLCVLAVLNFFGEQVKSDLVYSATDEYHVKLFDLNKNPLIVQDPDFELNNESVLAAVVFSYIAAANDNNLGTELVFSKIDSCVLNLDACLDMLDFGEGKNVCLDSISSSRGFGHTIRSEAPILLGFNKLVFNLENYGYSSVINKRDLCLGQIAKAKANLN